jgi:hypothetical protein
MTGFLASDLAVAEAAPYSESVAAPRTVIDVASLRGVEAVAAKSCTKYSTSFAAVQSTTFSATPLDTNPRDWKIVAIATESPFIVVGIGTSANNPSQLMGCLTRVSDPGSVIGFSAGAGSSNTPLPTSIEPKLSNWSANTGESMAIGEAGTAIDAMSLRFSAQRAVTASLSNGFYLATWKGDAQPIAVKLRTHAGSRTQELGALGLP